MFNRNSWFWPFFILLYLGYCIFDPEKTPPEPVAETIDETIEKDGNPILGLLLIGGLLTVGYLSWSEDKKQQSKKRKQKLAALQAEELYRQREKSELRRIILRDANTQDTPYEYEIGRHALETLALRYGIPHLQKDDKGRVVEGRSIRIRKVKRVGDDHFLATLPDYGDRKVIVVIEIGDEFVKTFYPLNKKWFDENSEWEKTLKGNSGFSIKELARMHVDRINSRPS